MLGFLRGWAEENRAKEPLENEIEKSHDRHFRPVLSRCNQCWFTFNRTLVTQIKNSMEKLLTVVALCGFTTFAFAQGRLLWNNTASTLISVNGVPMPANNPASPVTTFYFGLFIAPFGTPPPDASSVGYEDPNWQFVVDYTTNSTSAAGAGRLQNPGGVSVPGYAPATTISFMVRGWYYGAPVPDDTWDYFKAHPGIGYGQSEVGFLMLSGGLLPDPNVFGTISDISMKQIDGMNIIVVPEPSSLTMVMLGTLSLCFARRRHRRQSEAAAPSSIVSGLRGTVECSVSVQ